MIAAREESIEELNKLRACLEVNLSDLKRVSEESIATLNSKCSGLESELEGRSALIEDLKEYLKSSKEECETLKKNVAAKE